MPRQKNAKADISQAVAEVIDQPINLDFDETAQKLGIDEPELRDRLEGKLNNPSVHRWSTIPHEHELIIDAIARDLETESSVRPLNAVAELPVSQPQPEPPVLLEEEPKPAKRRGRPKKESTALTQQKTEEIQQTRQDTSEITDGIAETLIEFNAMEGLQDSSNAATAYLAAFETNLTNKKGEGAATIAAQILSRTAQKQNFSPNEVLNRLGVPLSTETRANLNEVMTEMRQATQGATEEMMDTAWGNGYSPKDALTRMRELRNLSN